MINYPKLQVLGHIVTAGGFRTPAPSRIAAILDLSEELKTKLQILAPLHDLNRNEGRIED